MNRNAVVFTADDETVKQDYRILLSEPFYRVEFFYDSKSASDRIFSEEKTEAVVIDDLFGDDNNAAGALIRIIHDQGLLDELKLAVCPADADLESKRLFESLKIGYFPKPIDEERFQSFFEVGVSRLADYRVG